MRHLFVFLGIFLLIVTSISLTFAQEASATVNTFATVVAPISISKNNDMNFGNVGTNGTVGTVVLPPTGERTGTGGVIFSAIPGSVTAASFAIAGSDSYTYSITLPGSVVITNGTDNMTVNAFTSFPSLTGTLLSGKQILTVGATLNLIADQSPGFYTSDTAFTVTVNYN